MPFAVAGFPTLDGSREIGAAYADGGADVVELGIACSDPHADGPVIREAGAAALRAGTSVDDALDVARGLAPRVPVVVMCYAPLVLARGLPAFADDLRDAGVSGLIVPDLAPQQAPAVLDALAAAGVALVPVVGPATPIGALARAAGQARGFVYVASTSGPTGERAALSAGVGSLVGRVKEHSSVPVALGFGISCPAQAAHAARAGADGVIVGSRLVRAAAEAADPPAAVRDLVAAFSAALEDGLHAAPAAATIS